MNIEASKFIVNILAFSATIALIFLKVFSVVGCSNWWVFAPILLAIPFPIEIKTRIKMRDKNEQTT